jgi:hypothetical protein
VEFPYIQNVYRLFGAEDLVKNVHLADEGHDYGPSKRAAAYKFLAKHLRLSLKNLSDSCDLGKIDESGTVVEKQETMRVFTTENPRPAYALSSDEAITKTLNKR